MFPPPALPIKQHYHWKIYPLKHAYLCSDGHICLKIGSSNQENLPCHIVYVHQGWITEEYVDHFGIGANVRISSIDCYHSCSCRGVLY